MAPCLRLGALPLLVALALVVAPLEARADPQVGPPPANEPQKTVEWNEAWPRFSIAEMIIAASVTARDLNLGDALNGPHERTVRFEVPVIDTTTRSIFRGRNEQTRKAFRNYSDVGFPTITFAPFVIDVGVAALAVHRNLDVAAQLALIDFEVLTIAGATQLLIARQVGRARPNTNLDDCVPESKCAGDPYRSFLSGHSMATFAAAGLMCLHHEKLPLFGGGAPDTWACVWALSVAAFTGFARVVADEHWTSDVMLGSSLGLLYGYFIPKLLHFHEWNKNALKTGSSSGLTWFPTFTGTTDSGVLGVSGLF